MPTIDHPTKDQLKKRYRVVAGPFGPHEQSMLEKFKAELTGCRIHVENHTDHRGATIWRLRQEFETVEETAKRLGRKLTPADLPDDSDES